MTCCYMKLFSRQFFHDADESEQFMLEDLQKLHDKFELTPFQGDYSEAERLYQELAVRNHFKRFLLKNLILCTGHIAPYA